MKIRCWLLVAALLIAAWAPSLAQEATNNDVIYQFSAMRALKAGVYDGFVTCGEMKQRGDFGIGTFDGLDGEMLEMNGLVYRAGVDGPVRLIANPVKSPFATVTFFTPDEPVILDTPASLSELVQLIISRLPTPNIPYAIRIGGTFDYVKTRSVPAQTRPYPPLEQVTKGQTVFELTNVVGFAVGFYFPSYMDGIQAAGCHLHFMTEDLAGGGHLLDCKTRNVRIEIDDKHEVRTILPTHGDFLTTDLTAPSPKHP